MNPRLRNAPTASAATRCAWARCRGRATSPRRSISPTCWRSPTSTPCAIAPEDPAWEGRDRFLLSNGHYAIALYAALIEAGIIPEAELETYGSRRQPAADVRHGVLHAGHGDVRRLARPGPQHRGRHVPRSEAQGLRRSRLHAVLRRRTRRRLDVGSDHVRGALSARQPDCDRRRQQPAGRRPVGADAWAFEPLVDKLRAFGWFVQRVDGNDLDAVVAAFDAAKASTRREAADHRRATR